MASSEDTAKPEADNPAPEAALESEPVDEGIATAPPVAPEQGPAADSSAPGGEADAPVDESAGAPEMSAEVAEVAAVADKDLPSSPAALKVLVKRFETERNEYLQQMQRVKADFENYRKRMLRQQTEHLERAAEALVEKLLPVLDNFDAAVAHSTGFEQVHASLLSTLAKEGLERIHPEGKPFDPSEADAVAHEDGDGGPVVAEVLRPGYRWKGRVVRPAMVRVRG